MSKYITKLCPQCGNEYQIRNFPSLANQVYCSQSCRNKALPFKGKKKKSTKPSRRTFFDATCANCGNAFQYQRASRPRKFCGNECFRQYQALNGVFAKGRDEIAAYICGQYPTANLEELIEETGLSLAAIVGIAHRNGIHRSDETKRATYDGFRERMAENNPMHNPETVSKVITYWEKHPEEMTAKTVKALQNRQRSTTSQLEKRCAEYLDELGIDYEHQAIIKDKFVVDFRIGSVILQCDGDYWHGHKRLEPLTERQLKQQKRDAAQDKYLKACGYTVIRVWESDMSLETIQRLFCQ